MQECPPGLRALLVPRSWGSPAPRGHGARAPAPSQAWHRLPVPARGWGPPGPQHNDGRAACPQPLHPWVRARWVIPIPPGAAATSAHAQHLETLSKPGLLDRPPPPPDHSCARGWGSSAPHPHPPQGCRCSGSGSHVSPKRTCPQKTSPARKQPPAAAAAAGGTRPGLGKLTQRGR